MRISDVRLLGDQCIVRCLGTADKQGSIHIPETAQDGRKIHRSGGDYIHRGEVLATGPGDKLVRFFCGDCRAITHRLADRIWKTADAVTDVARTPKCSNCGSKTGTLRDVDLPRRQSGEIPAATKRAPMPVKPGDIILYERRRDAVLQIQRFPSLELENDELVILLAEMHILAVLEPEDLAVAA